MNNHKTSSRLSALELLALDRSQSSLPKNKLLSKIKLTIPFLIIKLIDAINTVLEMLFNFS